MAHSTLSCLEQMRMWAVVTLLIYLSYGHSTIRSSSNMISALTTSLWVACCLLSPFTSNLCWRIYAPWCWRSCSSSAIFFRPFETRLLIAGQWSHLLHRICNGCQTAKASDQWPHFALHNSSGFTKTSRTNWRSASAIAFLFWGYSYDRHKEQWINKTNSRGKTK